MKIEILSVRENKTSGLTVIYREDDGPELPYGLRDGDSTKLGSEISKAVEASAMDVETFEDFTARSELKADEDAKHRAQNAVDAMNEKLAEFTDARISSVEEILEAKAYLQGENLKKIQEKFAPK